MIKFFRKIRQKLLEQSKIRSYFVYAIGEILLVVIGILIALQINDWNDNRKNRHYEITMLNEVKNALEIDSKVIQDILPYLQATMHSVNKLAEIKNDHAQSTDSLYVHLQRVFAFGTNISLNKSPYNTLQSGGLDKISNPDIRNNLSKLYGFTLSNSELWLNEVLRQELFRKKDLFSQIFGLQVKPGTKNSIDTHIKLQDPSIIYNNPEFDLLLSTSGWTLPQANNLLSSLNEEMLLLIDQINSEIKK
ncbi:DUF6090 family protein [Yeosuana sp. AK3]